MNAFREHHQHNIRHYRCFDRILLNGIIQPFQQEERVAGFFNTYRRLYPVEPQRAAGDCLAIPPGEGLASNKRSPN